MKRKKVYFILLLIIAIFLSGCMVDKVKTDILELDKQYSSNIIPVEKELSPDLEKMNQLDTSNPFQIQDFQNTLTSNIIPKYEKMCSKLQEITPQTPEVKKINDMMLKAFSTQLDGFKQMSDALNKKDNDEIQQANDKINQGSNIAKECMAQIDKLCSQHNIKVNN